MRMYLQAYAGAYRGHAKVDRLLFIADRTKNAQLALEAYKLAHDEAKQVLHTAGLSLLTHLAPDPIS